MSETTRLRARHLVVWATQLDKRGRLNVERFGGHQLYELGDALRVADFGSDPHLNALTDRVIAAIERLNEVADA
jgi:hypothetical protein